MKYKFFLKQQIPEIMDSNILPAFRGKGIGNIGTKGCKKGNIVGIGVGLCRDYRAAQKLYIIPDANRVTYNYQPDAPESIVALDDDLVLWFMKKLNG